MANLPFPTSQQTHTKKGSILNSISLNASRDRMSELFNDFKLMNIRSHLTSDPSTSMDTTGALVPGSTPILIQSTVSPSCKRDDETKVAVPASDESQGNDSIELVKVTMVNQENLSSLYVGDLDPTVTEEILYNYFKLYASLSSVKICYAPNSKRSLGYGYVNFESSEDAKAALEELNFGILSGREIRIMESFKGKDKMFLGTNVFISNLNTTGMTLRKFYEKFKVYGSILSCKLDLSKRQGFISFESKKVAKGFVATINGSSLDGSVIYCSIHIPKKLREPALSKTTKSVKLSKITENYTLRKSGSGSTLDTVIHKSEACKNSLVHSPTQSELESTVASPSIPTSSRISYLEPFREIYVKGLPVDCSETEVLKLFSCCGKILDIFLESVPHFKSSWCLVTFEANESAINAVETYHKTLYKGRRLTCVKALKKVDRQIQLYHSYKRNFKDNKLRSSTIDLETRQGSYKLYLYNLAEGLNENFFKLFLRNYTFKGKILRYAINSSNSYKDSSFIEFEYESDAKDVNAKLNGINICGYVLVSTLERKNIGSGVPGKPIKRSASVVDATHSGQFTKHLALGSKALYRIESDYVVSSFPKPSSIALSPRAFTHVPSPVPHQHQTTSIVKPSHSGRLNVSHSVSRSPSIKEDFQKPSTESALDKLQEFALKHVDFLAFPAATRPNNMRRIVQHIMDTCWGNNLEKVNEILKASEYDTSVEDALREKLNETIKLFGFGR